MRYQLILFSLQKIGVTFTSAKGVRVIPLLKGLSLKILTLEFEVVSVISVSFRKLTLTTSNLEL